LRLVEGGRCGLLNPTPAFQHSAKTLHSVEQVGSSQGVAFNFPFPPLIRHRLQAFRRATTIRSFDWHPESRMLAGPCEFLLLMKSSKPKRPEDAAGDEGGGAPAVVTEGGQAAEAGQADLASDPSLDLPADLS
jgi:hypothetical protein